MRKKIAIIHPKLGWGGSEATVLWMIEALKKDYEIFFITNGKVDVDSLNKYYGVKLSAEEFSVIQVPMPFGFKNTTKFAAIRGRFIQRYCQRISSQFDLMINAYNPCDFKKRGIQFATDIEELSNIIPLSGLKNLWYSDSFLRRAYLKICDFISESNPEEWKKNITLSNSDWTAKLMREKYMIDSRTLYPPVAGEYLIPPVVKREEGFVCIGRIIPEKRIDLAISILEKLRQKNHNIHIHIIGGVGNKRYINLLKSKHLRDKSWVFFEGRLDENDKKNIIASHKFGISCRKNEPFGIAVAEMVRTGCIVFVPDGGGQTEIVSHPDLIYKNAEDAVEKIENVIKNKELQNNMQKHLLSNAQKFSADTFKQSIKRVVDEFLSKND